MIKTVPSKRKTKDMIYLFIFIFLDQWQLLIFGQTRDTTVCIAEALYLSF